MENEQKIKSRFVPKVLLIINIVMALIYFSWWFTLSHIGNPVLYNLLLFGEFYHIIMALGFWYTMWPRKKIFHRLDLLNYPSVITFITVAGEPVEIVRKTAEAALAMDYPNNTVYILNDGYVAHKDNWEDIEKLAKEIGVNCITRVAGGGAKAGNINNGLGLTPSDLIAILDADMVPHKDFLSKLVPYLGDKKVGFVQSPQYYKNYQENNIAGGAWEQQSFFFGPIMEGKDTKNSAFICGTNVVIRREALEVVGGINEASIAEDFLTSLFIHKKKYTSVYIPEVLCEGLAPIDLLSYYKQQQRWARGSLEILFKYNPFFKRGLTFGQRIQYLLSALYYLNGVIVVIDMIMPLFYLYFGIQAVSATTTSFALYFIPYMFLSLYTLFQISDEQITFRAISFSQSSWFLQITALLSLLSGQKMQFAVTAKKAQEGNFLFLVYPHILYCLVSFVGIVYAYYHYGAVPSVVTNTAWVAFNIVMFLPFIAASYQWRKIGSMFGLFRYPSVSMENR